MDVVFDIDGTLADCSHRLPFITDMSQWAQPQGKLPRPNWEEFLSPERVAKDKPILPMWHLLASLLMNGHRALFITGRSEHLRQTTLEWLFHHDHPDVSRKTRNVIRFWARDADLLMRPQGNRQPSHVTKEASLHLAREKGWDPVMAFDDRKQDADMWRAQGLFCAQVNEGEY